MVQSSPVDELSRGVQIDGAAQPAGDGAAGILSGYDDDTLMARVQDGDKEAFEVIVARHMDQATAVATRFLADPSAGRRAAQEAFLQLWVARNHFRREGGFRWFLTTLVLDQCRNAANLGHQAAMGSPSASTLSPPSDPSTKRVHSALSRLDKKDREILVMRYGMALAYQDMSNETGHPANTLRSHVFESLRKLRGLMEGES